MSTEYEILRRFERDDGGEYGWQRIGSVVARSAKAAIRERIDGVAQSAERYGDGEYVAVPSRSWQPVSVRTETISKVKFS